MKVNSFPIIALFIALAVLGTAGVLAFSLQLEHEKELIYMTTAAASIDRMASEGGTGNGREWLPWVIALGFVFTSAMTAGAAVLGKGGLNGFIRQLGKRSHGAARPFNPAPVNEPQFVLAGQPVNDSRPLLTAGVNDESEGESEDYEWA